MLTGPNLQWVVSQEGVVPANSVEGGKTEDGETLYIGRAQHEGTTTIGKVILLDTVIPSGPIYLTFEQFKY